MAQGAKYRAIVTHLFLTYRILINISIRSATSIQTARAPLPEIIRGGTGLKTICQWAKCQMSNAISIPFYMTFGIWPIDPLAYGFLPGPVLAIGGRRNSDIALEPVRQVALGRKARRQRDIHHRQLGIAQKFLGPLDAPREHVSMWGLADGGFEGSGQVNRTDVDFGRHCLQAEVAIEIFFDVLDDPPHSPAGYRLHGRHAAWPRLGGVDARQMHGHHLGERIDVKP